MINKTMFVHLFNHFQTNKRFLELWLTGYKQDDEYEKVKAATYLGAIDCLYWQALGMGELLLAKHIRLYVLNRYSQHQINMSCIAVDDQKSQAA